MNHHNHRESRIEHPVSSIQNRVSSYLRAYKAPLHLSRTLYKSATFYAKQTQFPKSQMNVNLYITRVYEDISNWTLGQNKPNSNPIKPNLRKAQMNVNSFITKDYRKNDDFIVRKNKPNSNPISERPKMNANVFITKDYENETAFRPQKNKPKQSQFHLPPKPPIFSQNNSPFILPGQRIILHNHQALAVGFSGLIHVNSTCCSFYHFNCLWYIVQLWDLEYFATLTAVYPSVRGTAIKQPSTATSRALGDNLHQYIPYTISRKRNTIRYQPKPKIFYPWIQSLSIRNFLTVP